MSKFHLAGAGFMAGLRWIVTAALLAAASWVSAEPRLTFKPQAAAVAAAHPLATSAGLEILAAGGNAFDAAVAVSATLAVVEPYSSGLGGGGFWLLYRAADGFAVMVDGRERAPLAAHRDLYLDDQGKVVPGRSVDGALAAGIPGEPAALVHIAEEYGRLPLKRSLEPAIRAAREGFVVDAHYRRMARFRLAALQASPAAAQRFLRNGRVPAVGHRIVQPELAATLTALAEQGHDGFYSGRVARALVSGVRQAGGIWTLHDLAQYEVVERTPVTSQFRGLRIISAAPPSSGGVALATILNILDGYDWDQLRGVSQKHLVIEAMRRAYRDRAQYLGDPDFVQVPVRRLTHPLYAAGLRAAIRLDAALPSAALPGPQATRPQGRDTTHFSVLDRQGNRVAATLSINYPFGSGFMPADTGVLLNDEMDDFSSKPGTPNVYGLVGAQANAIAPGKRPLSSMTPTFLESEDRVAVLGTPGGSRIITMVLLALLEFQSGGDARTMVSLGRYHHQYLPDVVQYEAGGLTEPEQRGLRKLGHRLQAVDSPFGNMQVVVWDKTTGEVTAASDPRGVGQALVQRVGR